MQSVKNERGSVIVFVTLMIVLLMVMVGLGLDTGQLGYTRNMGQGAVDSAALAAVSGLPSRDATEIANRAANFNATNDYTGSSKNAIGAVNVSYVKYDHASQAITNYAEAIGTANGVRVALEGGTAMKTPVFLTPLMNLFGIATSGVQALSVSAVATITAKPAIPIAIWSSVCNGGATVKDVKVRQQNPQSGENSCWTTYLDKSSGANDVKALFKVASECDGVPISGTIDIGTPIYQNKGQQASDYDTAEKFFNDNSTIPCWYVPVITGAGNCDAKNPEKIVDWAKLCPTKIVKGGSHSYIQADVTCNQDIHNAEASLCFSHRLVREPAKGY